MKNFIQYDILQKNESPLQENEVSLQEHGGVRGEQQFPPNVAIIRGIFILYYFPIIANIGNYLNGHGGGAGALGGLQEHGGVAGAWGGNESQAIR